MNEFDILSHEKLGENLYVVRETLGRVNLNAFVVIGNEKAAVIDSGLGVAGGLRRYIEKNITDKTPILSYATHGDLDHIGSAILFDEYYLNHRDYPKLDWNLNVERRFSDLEVFCSGDPELMDFGRKNYIHNENIKFKDVDDGDIIDLGGVRLDVIMVPGHTPGCVAYLNREEHYVILGDAAIDGGSWQRCPDLGECLKYHRRFLSMLPEEITIYNNHIPPVPKQMLYDLETCFEEILAGKNENDVPFKIKFKFIDPEELTYDVWMHTVGLAKVPYNANTLKKR